LRKIIYIFLICLINISNSLTQPTDQSITPPLNGERLIYKMKYLNFTVANLTFLTKDTTYMNRQKARFLKVTAKSSGSAGMLFRLDNRYHVYFDKNNFLPLQITKNINQKNIQHVLMIHYDHNLNKATIGDTLCWKIPVDCYDYFSMLYFLRSQLFNFGDTIRFHLDSEYLISKAEVVVLPETEFIKTPAGRFSSIKVKINFTALRDESRPWKTDLLTNRLAAPGSELIIWLSDDELRLPLKISYQRSKINTHIILESFQRGSED